MKALINLNNTTLRIENADTMSPKDVIAKMKELTGGSGMSIQQCSKVARNLNTPVLGWVLREIGEDGSIIVPAEELAESNTGTEAGGHEAGSTGTEGSGAETKVDEVLAGAEKGSDPVLANMEAALASAANSGRRTAASGEPGQRADRRQKLHVMEEHPELIEALKAAGVDVTARYRSGRDNVLLFRSATVQGREMRLSRQKDGSYNIKTKQHIEKDRWNVMFDERIPTPADIVRVSEFHEFFGVAKPVTEAQAEVNSELAAEQEAEAPVQEGQQAAPETPAEQPAGEAQQPQA